MKIIDRLASSLGRRDEVPNRELAREIADEHNEAAVRELVENLQRTDKAIRSDCINVLCEIGKINPSMIAFYADDFLHLLDSKNNRLQWGAMTALSTITVQNAKVLYAALPEIIDAADKGSVITKDHAVEILVKLCGIRDYADSVSTLLNEQVLKSPVNQLRTYAEKAAAVIKEEYQKQLVDILNLRLKDVDQDSKRKRLERLIKKMADNVKGKIEGQ